MKDQQASRRGFFRKVAIGGAAAVGVVATAILGQRKSATSVAGADAPKQTGYRETEHIRQYYRTTQV
jgi:hypothetical protein